MLASIANDLHIKVADCRKWGAGTTDYGHREYRQEWSAGRRMDGDVQVGVRQRTQFGGTVFPADQHADLEGGAARMYSVYATKQVGDTLKKTEPITVSAFQDAKVKCEIPVP